MKAYRRSEGLAPLILNLSSTCWLLYPHKKNFWYPSYRRLAGPQSWHDCSGEKCRVLVENQTGDHPALSPVTVLAALADPFHCTQPSYKFSFGISIEIKKMTGKES